MKRVVMLLMILIVSMLMMFIPFYVFDIQTHLIQKYFLLKLVLILYYSIITIPCIFIIYITGEALSGDEI